MGVASQLLWRATGSRVEPYRKNIRPPCDNVRTTTVPASACASQLSNGRVCPAVSNDAATPSFQAASHGSRRRFALCCWRCTGSFDMYFPRSLGRFSISDPPKSRVHPAALALGALALGAFAIGALAIGALAIGRLGIKRARINRLEIDELVIRNRQPQGPRTDLF